VAVGTVDGKEVTRESFVSMISVGPKPDIELRIEPAVAELVPGGETVMTVHLTRNNGFAGRVRINVLNLPYGVDIADTGLNGVLITPGENQRTFKLTSLPWVSATDRIISVTGEPTTTVAERYDFASPSVTLRVTESPNKPAQVAGAAAR
jgi:hypothetical protein